MLNRDNVRKLMRAKGITAVQLASKVGVSPSMMSYILSGLRDPSLQTLIRMSDELECETIDELILR